MTLGRLYQCPQCFMIYWGHELLPAATRFPPRLQVQCLTPGCPGRVLLGQATPGESGVVHGLLAFFVGFGVLHWALKLDWLTAGSLAVAAGIAAAMLSRRIHKPRTEGEDQRFAASELARRAESLHHSGDLARAKLFYERASAILGTGLDPRFEGQLVGRLANIEKEMGNFALAQAHYFAALQIAEQIGDVSGAANRLNNIAALLGDDLRNPREAIPYVERAVRLARDLGDPARLVLMLAHLAKREREAGQSGAAESHADEAVNIARAAGEREVLAEALYEKACIALAEKRNSDAARYLREGLAAVHRSRKPVLHQKLRGLLDLVEAAIGDGAQVQILPPGQPPPDESALELSAEMSPEASEALEPGFAHMHAGRLDLAAESLLEALQTDSVRHDLRARALAGANLGDILRELGEISRAIDILRDAVDSARQTHEPGLECMAALNLGIALHVKGLWAEARRYLEQALDTANRYSLLQERGRSLLALGNIYRDCREFESAEGRYLEVQKLAEASHDTQLQGALNQSWGNLYIRQGRYPEALPYYETALEIGRQTRDSHLQGMAWHMIGNIHKRLAQVETSAEKRQEKFQQALVALGQSVSIGVSGQPREGRASRLHSLAVVELNLGQLAQARAHFQQAIDIYHQHGVASPDVAQCLAHFGAFLVHLGEARTGGEYLLSASAMDNAMIGQIFSIATEDVRLAFLEHAQSRFSDLLSLVAEGGPLQGDMSMVRACADVAIRRKGVTLEALAAQRDIAASGRYPELATTLQELAQVRMELAELILSGRGIDWDGSPTPRAAELQTHRRRLEQEIAHQVPEIELEDRLQSADREAIAKCLPPGSTLVEFVRFDLFRFPLPDLEARWSPARYAALVLPAGEPDKVQMIDLGEAEPIDRMIAEYRAAVIGGAAARPNRDLGEALAESPDPQELDAGLKLRLLVFDKLSSALSGSRHLLLSPDGDLTRLPFEVLPTSNGCRLIDEYRISYLGAGRDILRFWAGCAVEPTLPIVVADPDFNLSGSGGSPQPPEGRRPPRVSRDLSRADLHFNPLPGTRLEGEHIATILGVEPWLGAKALEARLKVCHSPRILHLATHGFFLEDQKHSPYLGGRDLGAIGWQNDASSDMLIGSRLENPLLRSGLAMAGVNTWLRKGHPPVEAEDGILTAEDVSGLNLSGTELVVLSACETGLGEVHTGEGVFGLRRAFALAGAQTLVMSLWKVPDLATAVLMQRFYSNQLERGMARAESLREAQLYTRDVKIAQMRSSWLMPKTIERLGAGNPALTRELLELAQQANDFCPFRAPFYWGAFICQGDTAAL